MGQEKVLKEIRDSGHEELADLLETLRDALNSTPTQVPGVRKTVTAILEYLVVPQNRTTENCTGVDWFIGLDREWKFDWRLPEALAGIVQDMGTLLHDAVESPMLAERLDATPEKLLEKIRQMPG